MIQNRYKGSLEKLKDVNVNVIIRNTVIRYLMTGNVLYTTEHHKVTRVYEISVSSNCLHY